jgi:hypothetical protein
MWQKIVPRTECMLTMWNAVQGHAGKFVFGQIGPQKTPVALLVGRAQSVHAVTCRQKSDIDMYSFYEGHTMDLVTFATRVCKVLGVETIIGTSTFMTTNGISDTVLSYKCSRRFESKLPCRRHCLPERCTSYKPIDVTLLNIRSISILPD